MADTISTRDQRIEREIKDLKRNYGDDMVTFDGTTVAVGETTLEIKPHYPLGPPIVNNPQFYVSILYDEWQLYMLDVGLQACTSLTHIMLTIRDVVSTKPEERDGRSPIYRSTNGLLILELKDPTTKSANKT